MKFIIFRTRIPCNIRLHQLLTKSNIVGCYKITSNRLLILIQTYLECSVVKFGIHSCLNNFQRTLSYYYLEKSFILVYQFQHYILIYGAFLKFFMVSIYTGCSTTNRRDRFIGKWTWGNFKNFAQLKYIQDGHTECRFCSF